MGRRRRLLVVRIASYRVASSASRRFGRLRRVAPGPPSFRARRSCVRLAGCALRSAGVGDEWCVVHYRRGRVSTGGAPSIRCALCAVVPAALVRCAVVIRSTVVCDRGSVRCAVVVGSKKKNTPLEGMATTRHPLALMHCGPPRCPPNHGRVGHGVVVPQLQPTRYVRCWRTAYAGVEDLAGREPDGGGRRRVVAVPDMLA
jgi:hypothetical protein